jgi:hypothetical protein
MIISKAEWCLARLRMRSTQITDGKEVYADLFDEDLDGVAARLDAAIKSTADPLRTQAVQ